MRSVVGMDASPSSAMAPLTGGRRWSSIRWRGGMHATTRDASAAHNGAVMKSFNALSTLRGRCPCECLEEDDGGVADERRYESIAYSSSSATSFWVDMRDKVRTGISSEPTRSLVSSAPSAPRSTLVDADSGSPWDSRWTP